MNTFKLRVRNVTEAAPELLRLLIREGRSRGDHLVIEDRVEVTYTAINETAPELAVLPESPLGLFQEALLSTSAIPMLTSTRNADSGTKPTGFSIAFNVTELRDAIGRVPIIGLIATQFSCAWRKTNISEVSISYACVRCEYTLVNKMGELLFEFPKPVPGGRYIAVDEQAATELRAFVQDPSAIGYRSRFIRRVAVPMFQAAELAEKKEWKSAVAVLKAATQTAWITASIAWIKEHHDNAGEDH